MKAAAITLCTIAIVACLVVGVVIYRNHAAREISPLPSVQRADNSAAVAQRASVEQSLIQPRVPQVRKDNSASAEASVSADSPAQKPPAKEPLHDPIARDALALVGSDPEAELYWVAAINDLSLPANERQDLIEDLNEEGLPDPKHPTPEDLPLILNRLALIEAVGPDAADQVNADAFLEAYKDLLNLAEVAMGGGEPVK